MTIKCDRFFNFILPIKCDRLNAGVYSLHYLVRSVTPGTFEWPSAEVYLQYAPEEFGRSASSSLEIVSEN